MVKVKTGFLSIQNLRSSDAQGVLAALKMSLENLGLSQEGEIPPPPLLALEGTVVAQTGVKLAAYKLCLRKNFLGPFFHGAWPID